MRIRQQIATIEEELLTLQRIPNLEKQEGDLKRELQLCATLVTLYGRLKRSFYSKETPAYIELLKKRTLTLENALSILQNSKNSRQTSAYQDLVQLEQKIADNAEQLQAMRTPEQLKTLNAQLAELKSIHSENALDHGFGLEQKRQAILDTIYCWLDPLNNPENIKIRLNSIVNLKIQTQELEDNQCAFKEALTNSAIRQDKRNSCTVINPNSKHILGIIKCFPGFRPVFCQPVFDPKDLIAEFRNLEEQIVQRETMLFKLKPNLDGVTRLTIYVNGLIAIFRQLPPNTLSNLYKKLHSSDYFDLMRGASYASQNAEQFILPIVEKLPNISPETTKQWITATRQHFNGLFQCFSRTTSMAFAIVRENETSKKSNHSQIPDLTETPPEVKCPRIRAAIRSEISDLAEAISNQILSQITAATTKTSTCGIN